MFERAFFCILPAERTSLAKAVMAAGGVPVLDFTASPTVRVPEGAWVRVNTRRSVPGKGPVILSGNHKLPVRNRETWLELTEAGPVPAGFAGAVLRGSEVGGPCGAQPGLALLGAMGLDQKVILDANLSPKDAAAAMAAGAVGVVLSEVLYGLEEMAIPQAFLKKIDRLDFSSTHVVNGFQIVASPLSPILRRLLDGEGFWDLAKNWITVGDSNSVAWPAGQGVVAALPMAAAHPSMSLLIGAYQAALNTPVAAAVVRPVSSPVQASAEPVAIIGLGCRLPGALSVPTFWENLLAGKSAIVEVPKKRWDWRLYWDSDKSVPDKTYAKIGGFLQDFEFNSRRHRIPPNVAKQVAIVQQMTLESVDEALDDAGYGKERDFDRSRVGVILGNSMGGEVTDDYVVRTRVPAFKEALKALPEFAALDGAIQSSILDGFEAGVKDPLPIINEDSMPGELSNVIAGRVANAFDLCGPNFTVDAACASSMAAMQSAVNSLQNGDVDMCITGGADRSMGVPTYTKFCKIGALSPNQSAPFDEDANGFVMGEGAGILVLKRLADARRDGDRVYAVIRGIGASSDGKGKGITAPNPRGQRMALERAYAAAGIDPVDVDLFECHGTSTIVGDKVEVESLNAVIGEGRRGDRGPIRIGSVKSNIGHLKSAAGAASCIKAALSVHHRIFPPSINFKKCRSDVPFDLVPLQVQTTAEPWPDGHVRRVGVSAFGFGGTNFHIVIEEYCPETMGSSTEAVVALPALADRPLPPAVWGLSAMGREGLVSALETGGVGPFDPSAPVRMAAAAGDAETKAAQIERALKVLRKGGSVEILRGRGIYVEETPSDGKVAFLFTGQGSQYIGMGLDLAAHYPLVQATFDEADAVMTPELGRPLTDFIRGQPGLSDEEQFERLRDTEISQPATLTVDIAIMRLLAAHGVVPDMVAGHSLGEYAAAVAAGILSFKDALVAVSARGREMANVEIADKGRMAGIAASVDTVAEVLAEIPGYVVPANKNCATQTVIAGASGAVEAAIEAFVARGITVYPLPVSHAFHSSIVAPASAPLKKVLERLDVRPPQRPITTNVTSRYYPSEPDSREEIIDILAAQVAAPVEWIAQVERMYADGVRIFVECGPKRALSGFVSSILKRRPHRVLYTNHPKRGGLASFQDSLAALTTLGFDIKAEPDTEIPDLFAPVPARLATSDAMRKWSKSATQVTEAPAAHATPFILRAVTEVVADATGYSPEELNLDDELEADLGIDTVKQAEVVAIVRDRFRLEHDPGFRMSAYRTLRDLANYAARRLGSTQPEAIERVLIGTRDVSSRGALPTHQGAGSSSATALSSLAEGALRAGMGTGDADAFAAAVMPAVQGLVTALLHAQPPAKAPPVPAVVAPVALAASTPSSTPPMGSQMRSLPTVVCSGAAIGLPGGKEVFAQDNVERILEGEVRISNLNTATQDVFLAKNVVRLLKDAKTGQGTFQAVTQREDVIRLAGVKAHFDLVGDYGVDPNWVRALDITTQLAFAAGVEALKDAKIPLVQTFHTTKSGKKVSTGWKLPAHMQSTTGVIFASAFPGYDRFAKHIRANGDDGEGRFDRRFLFQVLSMGHSQFAQYIGAQGPNAQSNIACASTTQAVAMASDWIALGRCERVVVIGADDVTSDTMIEWIGTGFLATGAATTSAVVEEAALPFDARRHGMILGMGAVGMVIEAEGATAERGVVPLARLLSSRMANSAFHGTRLNPEHIAGEMDALVAAAVEKAGVSRETFAANAMFMSHETYTPAKGGSAAAEIQSLRRAFGPAASGLVVTNTKGFTGHPMGAGIEDAIVLKALQYGRVPPIPHLKEPDPELGDLTLSKGGPMPLRFGIRLAAGFGSQLALLAWEGIAKGDNRVGDQRKYQAWLSEISGHAAPELVVEKRHLRVVAGLSPKPSEGVSPPAKSKAAPTVPGAPSADVLADLLKVIADKTGYGLDELELDFELEADLGIDTVKQAEIFGQMRDLYGIAPDESFRLADYPTIEALAGWLASQQGATPTQAAAPAAPKQPKQPKPDSSDVLTALLKVIADKTGYGLDELELDFELEADLGIDTVKQAEIFGQMRDLYGIAPDESFRLADYPTIESLAGWLAGQRGDVAGVADVADVADVVPGPSPAPTTDAVDTPEVLDALLKVIADKTGYGVDELELDFELEADLGIDTVKQAEIFGQMRDLYGIAPDENFRLADYPTIEGLAGWLAAQGGARVVQDEAPVEETPVAHTPSNVTEVAVVPAPELAQEAVVNSLPESFRLRRPVLVSRPPWAMGSIKGRVVQVLGKTALAGAVRARILKKGGVVGENGGGCDAVIDAGDDVLDSFGLAQGLDGNRPKDWICAAHTGHIASDLKRAQNAGARGGFAKAIGREWEACSARVININPSMNVSTAAALLIEELGSDDGSVEVFWTDDGRFAVELSVVPFPEQDKALMADVIVLTGGTRGITAQVGLAFAGRGATKLALLARTAPAETALDEVAAKAAAKAAIEARGDRATPAAVRDAVAPLKRAEEARQNLEQMRAFGADVRFFKVDLGDPKSIGQTLEQVREAFGPIDVLVHGAGVEESRLIADKDQQAFHRVFDAKAVGGLALASSLEASAFFVSMGSVAGRFGNVGQVDYAAANDAMAGVCMARPNALHVDWTAWADVGMAVRGGMETLLGERGVEMLPAQPGAQLLVDMVVTGLSGELMVAGKLGDFGIDPAHPLLDSVEMDGDTFVARRAMSLGSDPWIVDHSIDEKPVLPGVIGLEMMAAVAMMADPGHRFLGAENVVFKAPVKLHGDGVTDVFVSATPSADGVACVLRSSRTARTGRVIETEHFSATILWAASPTEPLPAMGMMNHPVSEDEIYQRFFHGPAFQVLRKVTAVTTDGLMAEGSVQHMGIAGGLLTSPLVLEAAFQAAGLHTMMVASVMALPMGIGRVVVLGAVSDDAPLQLTVRKDGDTYDVDVSCDGERVLTLRGFEMVEAGPLPPGGSFDPPKGGWSAAVIARVKVNEGSGGVLSGAEVAALSARGTSKRIADRVVGRVAAKRAVSELTGLDPAAFSIENRASGEPVAQAKDGRNMPHISISHRDGEGIAVAAASGRVGIDLEVVAARAPSFAETWFRPEERQWCGGDPRRESQVWAIKEAVLKVLGTGLRLSPIEVEVLEVSDGHASVRLRGEAATHHAALGGGELTIDVEDEQTLVIAVAWMAS